MSCTTILIGKKASYDGSTIIARNEDSGAGEYDPKKMKSIKANSMGSSYKAEISKAEIPLPKESLQYSSVPEAIDWHGVWAASGINEANVSMTATETITSNERILAIDPMVEYIPSSGKEGNDDYVPEKVGGFGEEDFVSLVLPFIKSAREGVKRLGQILEEYGTYEQNGIAFADSDEVWYMETIGGHNWMARKVPDDSYVIAANQLSIDMLDFEDCYGQQKEFMCSSKLQEMVKKYNLALNIDGPFNPRLAFGSISESDTIYNTPRVWSIQKKFNPHNEIWNDPYIDKPTSFGLPWSLVPERKLTIEDVKQALSDHYLGTPYDPYKNNKTPYRPIAVNRTNQLSVLQIRPNLDESLRSIHWISFACNIFNALVPMYPQVDQFPDYLSNTNSRVSTDSLYWASRLISALADPIYNSCIGAIEGYKEDLTSSCLAVVLKTDFECASKDDNIKELLEKTNEKIALIAKEKTDDLLSKILKMSSNTMKSSFHLSDN